MFVEQRHEIFNRYVASLSAIPQPIPGPELRRLAPILADIVLSRSGVKLSQQQLRLTPDKVKVVLPPKKELERMRSRSAPVHATLMVWVDKEPASIEWPQLKKLAPIIVDIISKMTRVRMSASELRLNPQKARIALPSREKLEQIRSRGTPVYATLLITYDDPYLFKM